MITSIFILFILYTFCCIADGPDIKPKLKVKISNYLRNKADSLVKVDYCNKDNCVYFTEFCKPTKPVNPCKVVLNVGYNPTILQHSVCIPEYERYSPRKNRFVDTNIDTDNYLIEQAKHRITRMFSDSIGDKIVYQIDKDNPSCSIYVTGTLVIL